MERSGIWYRNIRANSRPDRPEPRNLRQSGIFRRRRVRYLIAIISKFLELTGNSRNSVIVAGEILEILLLPNSKKEMMHVDRIVVIMKFFPGDYVQKISENVAQMWLM